MVETRCQYCGRRLRVTSLPAMCPKCRTPVSLPPSVLTSLPAAAPTVDEAADASRFYIFLWAAIASLLAIVVLAVGIDDLRLRIHQKGMVAIASITPPAPIIIYQPAPPRPVASALPATIPAPVIVQAPRAPPPPPPAPPVPPPGPFAELEAVHPYPSAPMLPGVATDAQIGAAIQKGVNYLLAQFSDSRLRDADSYDAQTFAGMDTLCVNALLHAGQAIDDPRLSPQSELMKGLLDRIKTFPMNGNRATYSRSLRISALTMYNRPEDRDAIEADYDWLLKNVSNGAYTYSAAPPKQTRPPDVWDNSNSQYGALGMWAASDAGLRPLGTYWDQVTAHWETCQVHSGGWGYAPGAQSATLAMTAAGTSILFAARDQTAADAGITDARPTPLSRSIELGLEWLDEGDHCVNLPGDHPGYTLYGIERAGLASGYKFFGGHDWYLELADQSIKAQQADGAWTGGDGDRAETAFRLLFLSRGRPPIFVNKLRFNGDWSFRPRDVANLTLFASHELERPLNWQVVGLDRSALEWSDCPVLYIASSAAPDFSDADVAKLHDFVEGGGMLFTQAERGSDDFDRFAADLARRLFPSLPLAPLPADSPLYSSMFLVNSTAESQLTGIWNGSRLLMVHSGADLSRQWHPRYDKISPGSLQLGTNVVVYAAGRRNFLNRTGSLTVPPISAAPLATIPIARLRYGGNWDPEPGAWRRMARLMQFDTGVSPVTTEVDLDRLTAHAAPLAHLTGTASYVFTDGQVKAVQKYITDGGVLFIDSCGGSSAFADSVKKNLIEKLSTDMQPEEIGASHPLLNNTSQGMLDLTSPKLRLFDVDQYDADPFRCSILHLGKGDLIFCDIDVTSGLLGTNTWGIKGYQADYAAGLMNNIILRTMRTAGRISPR
jgi:hypothetical protein